MATSSVWAQVPVFAGLSAAELATLAAALRPRHYAKGEVIFHEQDPGNTCYIVETGRVKVATFSPDGRQITLALLGPGDLFGELALLDGVARSTDAVALEACRLLELPRDRFLDFLRAHWETTSKLLAVLAHRLRRTDELLEDALFLHVPARLAKALLELAESQGERVAGAIRIAPHLTQSDLAALVGTSRESVNKWLGFYQQRGIVQLDAGTIVICRPQELRRNIY